MLVINNLRIRVRRVVDLSLLASAVMLVMVPAAYRTGYAQAPEQRFFDWAHPPFDDEEYVGRLQGVAQWLVAQGGGILMVPSRDALSRGETFRQNDDFMYLTGLELPNAMLVMNADAREVLLFMPDWDPRFEHEGRRNDFPGRPLLGDTLLSRREGMRTLSVARLDETMSAWASSGRPIYVNAGAPGPVPTLETDYFTNWTPEQHLIYHIQQRFGTARLENAYPLIASLRMVKSSAEIARMHAVARLTGNAIAEVAQAVRPGLTERDLEAVFVRACKAGGAQRIPFAPIVKSGPNALWPWRILASHYNRANRMLQDGEVVVLDVGCELGYYVSDVGRTFPVSGTFSDAQRRVLTMQRDVSDAIIAAVRPGVTFAELQAVARDAIPEADRPYMQAAGFFGHHIGMSAGDPSLDEAPLQAGMVFTVEPWYYNHQSGVAGFLEDVILVTDDGAENLTAYLPRSPERLELLMKGQVDLR